MTTGLPHIGYAVLERSESYGISSLDHEIFLEADQAAIDAEWHAEHLTGSYADAGDTKVEVVSILLTAEQYSDIANALYAGPLA